MNFAESALASTGEVALRLITKTATVVALAGVMLTGHAEQVGPVTPETLAVTSYAPEPHNTPDGELLPHDPREACTQHIEFGAAIALAECVELPPILPGDYKKVKSAQSGAESCDEEGSSLIGYTNQGSQQKADVSGMPPAHAAAAQKAAEHPVVKSLLGYAEGGVHYYANMGADSEEAVNPDIARKYERPTFSDIIKLCFEVAGGDQAFTTPAGIRLVAIHEGAHAAHYQIMDIAKGKGPKAEAAKAELTNLQELCRQEFSLIIERFRAMNELAAIVALQKVRDEFAGRPGRDNMAYVQAINELMQRFQTKDGLQDVLIDQTNEFDSSVADLYDLIDVMKARQGNPSEKKIYDQELKNSVDWSVLDVKFSEFFYKQLDYMREGAVFKGMTSPGGGHPTNVTEQIASAVGTTQMHPKAVTKAANKLSPEHRQIVADKLATMQRLMELLNPELAAQLKLGEVARSILRYKVERQIAAEFNTVITLTGGDWHQLPSSRARAFSTT